MSKMTPDDKKKALSEFAPRVWEMYKHLYEVRTSLEPKLNYFLAINTLFLIGYLQLFGSELKTLSVIHFVPFLLLVLPMMILLVHFFSKPLRTPWFEKDHLCASLEKDTVTVEWIAAIFNCAYLTWYYMLSRMRLLKICLVFVGLALSWMLVVFVLELYLHFSPSIEQGIILILTLLLVGGMGYAIGRKRGDSIHQDRPCDVREFLNEWLSKRDKT